MMREDNPYTAVHIKARVSTALGLCRNVKRGIWKEHKAVRIKAEPETARRMVNPAETFLKSQAVILRLIGFISIGIVYLCGRWAP